MRARIGFELVFTALRGRPRLQPTFKRGARNFASLRYDQGEQTIAELPVLVDCVWVTVQTAVPPSGAEQGVVVATV